MINLFALSGLLNALVGGFLVFLVLFRGTKLSHITFSLFSGFVFLWSLFYFLWQVEIRPNVALFYCRTLMMGAIPIPGFFFHYCAVLTDEQIKYKKWIWGIYALSGVFVAANLFGLIVAGVEPRGIFAHWPVPGPLLPFQLIFFGIVVFFFLGMLIRGRRNLSGIRREQVRYVFVGAVLAFFGGLTNYFWWFNIPINPWGNFLVFLGDAVIGYGFLRYRLMDISLAARNVIAYAFFLCTVAGPIALLVWWSESTKWALAGIVSTGVVTPFLFGRLKDDVLRVIDRLPPFRNKFGRFLSIRDYIHSIKGSANLEDWAWRLVEAARNLYGTKCANVLVWQVNEEAYVIKAGCGLNAGERGFLSLSKESPVIQEMFARRGPVAVDQMGRNDHNPLREEIEKEMAFLHSCVCVPIYHQGHLWAVLNLDSKMTGEIYNDLDFENLAKLISSAEQQLEVVLSGLTHFQTTSLWANDLARPFGEKGSLGEIEALAKGKCGPLGTEANTVLERVADEMRFVGKHLRRFVKGKDHPLSIAPQKMDEMCQRVVKRFERQATDGKINLRAPAPGLDVPILCDGGMIEYRVYGNLVENALRHTPPGGTVEVGYRLEENTFVGYVRDTGPGLKKEDIPRLFTPGLQLEGQPRGLAGLGLTSVKSVIDAHGGRVWVESTPGQGSAFYFSLPSK